MDWGNKSFELVKKVLDVKCYMDVNFDIIRQNGFDLNKYKNKEEDYSFKTFALRCGTYDGEQIDLFELQRWFKENEEWINELKKETL